MGMRLQTGGGSTFGIGVLTAMSSKKNMNSTFSKELEVIDISEYLP